MDHHDHHASLEALMQEAHTMLENGDYEEALEKARLLLAKDDSIYHFWCLEGSIRVALGELQAAERSFDRACQVAPEQSGAYLQKAGFYNAIERFEEAIDLCETAIDLTEHDDERRDGYYLTAEAHLLIARRQFILTLEELQEELTIGENNDDPSAPLTPEMESELLDTLEYAQKALDIDEEFADAWHLRANALLDLRRLEEAIDALYKATDLAPFQARFWNDLGTALEMNDDLKAARKAYHELHNLEMGPGMEGMDFARQEFASISQQVIRDIQDEALESIDGGPVPRLEVETQDFPDADLIDEEIPFNPWLPFRLEFHGTSPADGVMKFILYQRNIEREAQTEDGENLYIFLRNLIEELLISLDNYEDNTIEA